MRKLMWFTMGFGIACVICAYFYAAWILYVAIAALLLGVLCGIFSRKLRLLRLPAWLFVALFIGSGWCALYNGMYLQNAKDLDGLTAPLTMEVTDYSYQNGYGTSVKGEMVFKDKTYQVLAYLDEDTVCRPGDKITGRFRFRYTALGGSKDPTYHRSEGIFLLAYASGESHISQADTVSVKHYPAIWRRSISLRIDEIFTDRTAAFAKALLLGDRTDIDYETNTAFKVSGICHIIAVSGLHVSVLFSLVYLLSGKSRVLSCILGIPVLFVFAAVAGFTPSITRACIMHSLMLIAMIFRKEYDGPTALSFAVMIMVLINPMVVISISFQLSVGCMIGIFLFSERIKNYLQDEKRLNCEKGKNIGNRLKRWFASSVSISLGAGIVTTPLVAWYFDTVSLFSLVTNLLILWLITYVFCGIILSCAVSLLSLGLGTAFAWVVGLPIKFILLSARTIARFPLAAVYTQSKYIVIWLIGAYLLLAVFLCLRKKNVPVLCGCICTLLCTCLLASWAEPLLDRCRVTVLDVGQGQCVLLQGEGKTFLVDCGGDSDSESADIAAETLLSQGIFRLDGLIVTHYDNDHVGGVPYLLSRIAVDTVYLPAARDKDAISWKIRKYATGNTVFLNHDIRLTFGEAVLTIFGPEGRDLGNESSLCVLLQRENCDILITGDRSILGEKLLMQKISLPKLEVLIAGHHGAKTSTGDALLEACRPEYVLISVGRNNPYGHPSQEVMQRLNEYECTVIRTDLNGTIVYRG